MAKNGCQNLGQAPFLYLRPTMIGNGTSLGGQKPTEALLCTTACCFPNRDAGTAMAGLHGRILSGSNKMRGLKLLR